MLYLDNISKFYRTTEVETAALLNVSIKINTGEFVAIMGPSGCGKSTLLNILGMLDKPTSGTYFLFDKEINKLPEKNLAEERRSTIGFIFQNSNLIEDLNVFDNIEVALIYRKIPIFERRKRIVNALESIGLSHRVNHFPSQLSGGQQQRIAIARAMVSNPKIILADEPTGNLDSSNGDSILELLSELSDSGTTIVMVTHSPSHALKAQRTIEMLDGKICSGLERA